MLADLSALATHCIRLNDSIPVRSTRSPSASTPVKRTGSEYFGWHLIVNPLPLQVLSTPATYPRPVGASNDQHQRWEPAAEDSRIVTDLNGWLSSAACCG